MSSITTIYDSIVARLAAVLPDHHKLPQAYNIENNPETMLVQGYALGIGPGLNTKKILSETISFRREFIVTLTRSLDATELDLPPKQMIEKSLLEDWRAVIVDLESQTELRFTIESDSGIQYIQVEKDEFVYIQATVSVEYFENFC